MYFLVFLSGGFHKYDLGSRKNEDAYGTVEAPTYFPENVNVPVSLYWGQNDWLATPAVSFLLPIFKEARKMLKKWNLQDVLSLDTELPDVYDNFEVDWDQWNHMDFIYGIDADTLLYPQLMDNMARAQDEFYPLPQRSQKN